MISIDTLRAALDELSAVAGQHADARVNATAGYLRLGGLALARLQALEAKGVPTISLLANSVPVENSGGQGGGASENDPSGMEPVASTPARQNETPSTHENNELVQNETLNTHENNELVQNDSPSTHENNENDSPSTHENNELVQNDSLNTHENNENDASQALDYDADAAEPSSRQETINKRATLRRAKGAAHTQRNK